MGKIKSTLKTLIFIWGILTLGLVLFVTITLSIKSLINQQTAEMDQKEAYENHSDDILLTVQERSDKNQNAQLVNISKSGKPLVSNYQLPIDNYGLKFPVQIKDSKIIPVKENEYRIILYSTYYECAEESTDYIWFFKLNNKLNLVYVLDLSEVNKNDASGLSFFGYKYADLPYYKNAEFRHFIIPIGVNVGETIKIAPLLNKSGMELFKVAYESEAEKRIATLKKSQNFKMLAEYKTALIKFKDIITEKNITY